MKEIPTIDSLAWQLANYLHQWRDAVSLVRKACALCEDRADLRGDAAAVIERFLSLQILDYDAGAVADDVLIRMLQRGALKPDELRIIYKSQPFPAGSLAVAHDLDPMLKKKIIDCTFTFRFPADLSAAFRGPDRFVPLNYKVDYASVRHVAEASGESLNRTGFEARKTREQELEKKITGDAAKK